MSVMDQPDEPDDGGEAVDPDIRHEVADADEGEPTTSDPADADGS